MQYFHSIFFLMRILHQIHFPERTFTYKVYYLKIIDRDSWLIDNSLLDICLFLSRSINMLFDVLHRITLFYLIAVHNIDTWLLTSKLNFRLGVGVEVGVFISLKLEILSIRLKIIIRFFLVYNQLLSSFSITIA